MNTTTIKTSTIEKTIPITIRLNPSQVLEAYDQLLKAWKKKKTLDWMDKPEILAMLEKEAEKAEKEWREGKTISVEQLRRELKM